VYKASVSKCNPWISSGRYGRIKKRKRTEMEWEAYNYIHGRRY
jgi:hypothetical protein